MIEAWNKIDVLADEEVDRVRAEAARREDVVVISALTGDNVDALLECSGEHLRKGAKVHRIVLDATDGEGIAWLYANGEILGQSSEGLETEYEVRLSDADWARFKAKQEQAAS